MEENFVLDFGIYHGHIVINVARAMEFLHWHFALTKDAAKIVRAALEYWNSTHYEWGGIETYLKAVLKPLGFTNSYLQKMADEHIIYSM